VICFVIYLNAALTVELTTSQERSHGRIYVDNTYVSLTSVI